MRSATRDAVAALLLIATTVSVAAQDGWFGRQRRRAPRVSYESTTEYDGRFSFVRIRYGAASQLAQGRFFRGEPPWAHDFPRADFNFLKILGELTFVRAFVDESRERGAATLRTPQPPAGPSRHPRTSATCTPESTTDRTALWW